MSADLTDATAIQAMFAPSAPDGAVDIPVNNAGIYPTAAIEEMTSAEWAEVFARLSGALLHTGSEREERRTC